MIYWLRQRASTALVCPDVGGRDDRNGAFGRCAMDAAKGRQIGSECLVMPHMCPGQTIVRRLACSGRGIHRCCPLVPRSRKRCSISLRQPARLRMPTAGSTAPPASGSPPRTGSGTPRASAPGCAGIQNSSPSLTMPRMACGRTSSTTMSATWSGRTGCRLRPARFGSCATAGPATWTTCMKSTWSASSLMGGQPIRRRALPGLPAGQRGCRRGIITLRYGWADVTGSRAESLGRSPPCSLYAAGTAPPGAAGPRAGFANAGRRAPGGRRMTGGR